MTPSAVAWMGRSDDEFRAAGRSALLTAREEFAMVKVIADITMSLDGYVTGEGADVEHGLGDAPELHAWVFDRDPVDDEILEKATAASGAVVMGRRLFDTVNSPDGWNEEMGYGADQTGTPPFFVVSHSVPTDVRLERDLGMHFTFAGDLVTAIDQARSAATHGDVVIMGGGDIIGQALEAGLVDELRLHLAPLILGGGTPLFKPTTRRLYRQREVRASRNAVHLTYERV
jgi:dihydrofolate reductase